ncbi:hypothetical protein CHISP_2996 [Chitinispirillum alkaliphilum]|nr:hypothetical protein CHISP_2996 [Chitinispirillum alkaliphilum]
MQLRPQKIAPTQKKNNHYLINNILSLVLLIAANAPCLGGILK